VDEQFGKFVEVIQKLNVNIPFLKTMQVPTYAKYLKDILNNKRPLPTMDMVKLTEECSTAILKKKDPGCPTISCSIGAEHFENSLCDLEASVGIMPNSLRQTQLYFLVAYNHVLAGSGSIGLLPDGDSGGHFGESPGFLRTRGFHRHMDVDKRTPLILRRPFLSTSNANIDVGTGEIRLNINSEEERFTFKPKVEQCSQVRMVDRKLSNLAQENEVDGPSPRWIASLQG
jgi:hypothetical protein